MAGPADYAYPYETVSRSSSALPPAAYASPSPSASQPYPPPFALPGIRGPMGPPGTQPHTPTNKASSVSVPVPPSLAALPSLATLYPEASFGAYLSNMAGLAPADPASALSAAAAASYAMTGAPLVPGMTPWHPLANAASSAQLSPAFPLPSTSGQTSEAWGRAHTHAALDVSSRSLPLPEQAPGQPQQQPKQ